MKPRYKAMYKRELADLAGTNPRTLTRWMRTPNIAARLEEIGIKPTAHLLPPSAVELIATQFGIDIPE